MPKIDEKRQKGAQREPKGAKREAKGSPGSSKTDEKSKLYLQSVSGSLRDNFGYPFWFHFGFILGAKIGDVSCYFWASFFDRFLKTSGAILGASLGDVGS